MDDSRASAQTRAVLGYAVIVAGIIPALAGIVVGIVGDVDLSPVVRLLVTTVVYGPVAALALAFRRPGIAAISGSLAVTSGWFALAFVLATLDVVPRGTLLAIADVARLPEVAALSVIPWLLARAGARRHGAALAVSVVPVGLDAAFSIVDVTGIAALLPLALALASFVAGAVVLTREHSRDPRMREALTWYLAGVGLLVLSYVRVLAPLPPVATSLGDAAFVLAQALLPVGILAAVSPPAASRPSTRTVDAIAWAQAIAFGASAYLAADAVTTALAIDPVVAGAARAAALALVLGATVRSARARLGRLFSERRLDARDVLARLGARVGAHDDDVRTIAAALRDAWQLASVAIVVDGTPDVVRVGDPQPQTVEATLVSGGRRIGSVELTAPADADLDRVVRPVLAQTSGLIAVAVHLASINEEVAATRRRTSDLRSRERRHLHAELHDDVAPALAGIGFAMTAADALLERGDHRAAPALARLRHDVAETTETVRALARALLPTALDQGDLAGALDELARTSTDDRVHVAITAEGSDVLPSERQLALYLLLAEAVRVVRRSEPSHALAASVAVGVEAIRVSIRVDPDGEAAAIVADAVERRARELGGYVSDGAAVIPR